MEHISDRYLSAYRSAAASDLRALILYQLNAQVSGILFETIVISKL